MVLIRMIFKSLSVSSDSKMGEGAKPIMAVAYLKSQVRIASAQVLGSLWSDAFRTRWFCAKFGMQMSSHRCKAKTGLTFPPCQPQGGYPRSSLSRRPPIYSAADQVQERLTRPLCSAIQGRRNRSIHYQKGQSYIFGHQEQIEHCYVAFVQ